jgi:hypothetical protein
MLRHSISPTMFHTIITARNMNFTLCGIQTNSVRPTFTQDSHENRSLYARLYKGYNADKLASSNFLGKENKAVYWMITSLKVDCFWNVMAHAQKPDFFRRNGRVHLNQQGRQFSRLLQVEVCGISGSNDGYTMFRGSVKSTGYPRHSAVSPSLPLPCVTVCHHVSTGLYHSPRVL